MQRRGGTQPRPDARLSLFCFHQAGGSSSLFDALQGEGGLPGDIEVLPVELPGRNARLREPRLTSMGDVVAAALAALAPALERRPFAVLGHSMGAWVAYAVAQELQHAGGPLPAALYVSANRSARLAGAQHDVDATRLHALPSVQFWEAMERRYGRNPLLEDPAVRRFVLPTLRADFQIVETFQPADPDRRLPCPVVAIGALQDTRYTPEQLSMWAECAPPGAFRELWVPGGHGYLAECPGPLLDFLCSDLLALLDSAKGEPGVQQEAVAGEACAAGRAEPSGCHLAEEASALEPTEPSENLEGDAASAAGRAEPRGVLATVEDSAAAYPAASAEDRVAAYPAAAAESGPKDRLAAAPGGVGEQQPREKHRQSSWCCF